MTAIQSTDRYDIDRGMRVTVQVPDVHVETLLQAILQIDRLRFGDYDAVSFRTALGSQTFRSLGTGRNAATEDMVEVACVELSFWLPGDQGVIADVLQTIYAAHPYEEPVIFITPATSPRHIRGVDEENPNRFWNSAPQDWVPKAHR